MTYGEAIESIFVVENGGYPNPASNLLRPDIIAVFPTYLDAAMQKFAMLNRQQRRADGEQGLDLSATFTDYELPLTLNPVTNKYYAQLPGKVIDTAAGPLISSVACDDLGCEAPVQRSFSAIVGTESLPIVTSWLSGGDRVYLSKAELGECNVVVRAILAAKYEHDAEILFPGAVIEDAIAECRKFVSKMQADKQLNSIDDTNE